MDVGESDAYDWVDHGRVGNCAYPWQVTERSVSELEPLLVWSDKNWDLKEGSWC